MLGPQSNTPASRTPRLLKPGAILRRLRPVRLTAFGHQMRSYQRLALALSLIRQHFPAALADYNDLSSTGWWEALAHLANLVEAADWFPVNWPALNQAWAYWMEEPDAEQGDHLAIYLHYLPVALQGVTDGETLFQQPPMELLHALLADCDLGAVSAQLLIDAEIYDGLETWGGPERASAWRLLETIEADPGLYPEPVRWLPELARWACHRTGNIMLDATFDPYNDGPWYMWRRDLAEIQTAWRRAQPVIRAGERLQAWIDHDPTNLALLANFLMNGGPTDELDW